MVADDHEVAHVEVFVDAAGGVGQEQDLGAHETHQTGGQQDILNGIALVIVDAALHDDHLDLAEIAEDETAPVACDGGNGEAFDVVVVYGGHGLDLIGQSTQAGAEDQSDVGNKIGLFAHAGETFLQLFVCSHGKYLL